MLKIRDWLKAHNIYSKKFYKKGNKSLKRWLAVFFTSFLSVLLVASIALVILYNSILGMLERSDVIEDITIPDAAVDVYGDKDVVNIMLYGIDSRDLTEMSRSDSIMLITIDRKNVKVKMTSIARDTLVDIEGYGKDKLNHAFIYGWNAKGNIAGGAALSLKTINNAFNLNVSDYVTANFWALATIIDYIGGVEIDVDAAEMADLNKNYISYIQEMGIDCDYFTTTGMQHVTGGQAVAYCRVRHVGGDVMRGQRQREVLMAMYDKVKTLNPVKYPKLISLILSECSTSLSNNELLSLGTWAVSNMNSLTFETLGIPTEDIESSQVINGVWYYTYDLDKAAKKIEEFILEPEDSPSGAVTEE